MICQICNEEVKSKKALAIHINNKHIEITKEQYYIKYISINNEHLCKNCGNKNKFRGFSKGFGNYCSQKCMANSSDIKEKKIKTLKEKYGVENISQIEEVKQKKKDINLEKYGVEYYLQTEEYKQKIKDTCLKKYGVENIMYLDESKLKIKKTNRKRYGVDSPIQNKEIKNKIKNTNLKKYGTEYYSKTDEYKRKIKETCLNKYGVHHHMLDLEIRNKVFSKHKENMYEKLLNSGRLQGKVKPLFTIDEYKNVFRDNKYKFQCTKCDNEFFDHLDYGRVPRCLNCYPYQTGTSKQEQEIYEYVKLLLPENTIILQNDRTVLNPYELDIYVPEYNFAIEFNGLYWHTEENGKNKFYHFNKTKQCIEKNIQLFQIFEDEWLFKSEIVKSLIKTQLNLNHINDTNENEYKIEIVDDIDILYDFYLNNRLHDLPNEFENGNLNFIGILCNNDLIALISYIQIENNSIEIIDYTEKINTNIYNGFNKLKEYLFEQYDFIYYIKDLNNYDMNLFNENKFKYLKPKYYLKENSIWDCGWSHINLKEVV